jgi:hypothetical protein
MEKDTPEYFYREIQGIQKKMNEDETEDNYKLYYDELNEDETEDNYKLYYDELTGVRKNIQTQIDLIVTEKPVKSQQLLANYKELYDTNYMTNFCLFLGICLILWYILTSNNTTTQSNVPTNNTPN